MEQCRHPFAISAASALSGLLLAFSSVAQAAPICDSWSAWTAFRDTFMNSDGRIVDPASERKHTVSEGQAYGLFFALVANDRSAFEKILGWTEARLAQGDLASHLPAWQWGLRDDGEWGILDDNSAADADVWIAYALGEAGRLWHEKRYSALSALIAERILREETADLPGLGITLLPAPQGFHPQRNVWRLNPSYAPMQVLRRLAATHPQSAWPAVTASALRMITASAPQGFAPDWVVYHSGKGFAPDEQTQALGSYNAIRVYLWAGTLSRSDPAYTQLRATFAPMARYISVHGVPPEIVDTSSGATRNSGPVGYSAAALPLLKAAGNSLAVQQQLQRIAAFSGHEPAYYDQALTLFGQGWMEGRYRYARDGSLLPAWKEKKCLPARPPVLH